ncbi:MAG: xanthine dehydrogenase family protein molybdopterin-binding subunit [Planctomycetota bacterium]
METRKYTARLGHAADARNVEIEAPAADPKTWDLDAELAVVGGKFPRLEAVEKVTGSARYASDVRLPGMLYAAILRCPHPHARVRSIDTSRVKALPSVKAVWEEPSGKECRFAGEEIAAVAAVSRRDAREALRAIRVEYDVLPFVCQVEKAMEESAPRVFADRGNVRSRSSGDKEAVEQAFDEADVVLEREYRTQVQTHVSLETHGCVCQWEGDHLNVWHSTQGTFTTRAALAQAFSLQPAQVRVLAEHVGGGFGSKLGADRFLVIAAHLARDAGAPVHLFLDRREEHLATGNRPNSIQRMRVGIKKDGKLSGAIVETFGTAGVAAGGAGCFNPAIYDFGPVFKTEATVMTHAGEGRPQRAPGRPQGIFAVDSMIDELAEAIGLGPLAVRRLNDPSSIRQAEYEIGAKAIGWDRRRNPPGSDIGPIKRGLGMACSAWPSIGSPGGQPRWSVICQIYRDGSVELLNGAQDIGTGTRTLLATVAAEELGITHDRIRVGLGDTSLPPGPTSGGSTTAPSLAPAARAAAHLARAQLLELVADELEVEPEDLEARGGRIAKRGEGATSLSFAEACELMDGEMIRAEGVRADNYAVYYEGVAGCQFAEVEVDVETGLVRVIKVVAVHDCGRVINRLQAENQVIGGVIQGMSYALHENRILDRNTGTMVNPDLLSYKVSGSRDMPEIVPIFYDVANGGNNVGLAGLGEPPVIPTAAAIANAITNATGARVRELPITPDKVLAALERARRTEGGK